MVAEWVGGLCVRYGRIGGRRDGHNGGVKGLMKQEKKGKICFVIYIAGERIFFIIYDVIMKQVFL